ncbi:MAG TPA: hypothetical protein VMK66_18280 [Myxococcales bacterium]|nr:hypothetical protein [Myxococcales bacterium]
MARALLTSILVALIALPCLAARERNGKKGLKKTLFYYLAFNLFWLIAVRYLYMRLA